MLSLRSSTTGLSSPISIRGLASAGNLRPPISLRQLILSRSQGGTGVRFCGVPDPQPGVDMTVFGTPGGRWSRGTLTFHVDSARSGMAPNVVDSVISRAFALWQQTTPFFAFSQVNANSDIEIRFGGSELDTGFGKPGGILGVGQYPERGHIYFDDAETWSSNRLLPIALHEVGHALGLSHSTNRSSVMYPFDEGHTVVDAESAEAIRTLYGWHAQTPLVDRGTSDGPALAVAGYPDFTNTYLKLYMAWKGTPGDTGLYWSQFADGAWSPQSRIEGVGSSHGPALASYPVVDAQASSTGLFLAWKGIPGDAGLYYSTYRIGLDTAWAPEGNRGRGNQLQPGVVCVWWPDIHGVERCGRRRWNILRCVRW